MRVSRGLRVSRRRTQTARSDSVVNRGSEGTSRGVMGDTLARGSRIGGPGSPTSAVGGSVPP